ncbi:MAG: PEP-CTERM sorting domain-containing protein [Akkermansiaceae bacterium]|nr:PEP-CTERM sorting domain-containing protein [Akkermansiaceae bacterium]
MKTKFLTLIAIGMATAASQAFTIDFNALVVPLGTTVTSTTPLTVNVAGYGDVKFEVANPDVLVVGMNHQNDSGTYMNSLELDAGETVLVTFLGPKALNVDFDIIGINAGESANPVPVGFSGSEYQLDAIGGNGVGIAAISWNTVPEPSSSLLVLVGAGSLILRRRRD